MLHIAFYGSILLQWSQFYEVITAFPKLSTKFGTTQGNCTFICVLLKPQAVTRFIDLTRTFLLISYKDCSQNAQCIPGRGIHPLVSIKNQIRGAEFSLQKLQSINSSTSSVKPKRFLSRGRHRIIS
jgi:hypothetical protein